MGMGFIRKGNNSSSSGSENRGMGFFFVFVPEERHNNNNPTSNFSNKTPKLSKNNNSLFSSTTTSSSPSFKLFNTLLRRTNSSQILYKAQSTISICALLFFITLLLFTLSTFELEPSSASNRAHHFSLPRRHLSSSINSFSWQKQFKIISNSTSHALQGMGTLYRRGTRAMSDLVVAHAVESLTSHELKLFLRLLHRSSLVSRTDILFIFPSKSASFDATILEENDSFLKLITQYGNLSRSAQSSTSFDMTQFMKLSKKEKQSGETIWGKKIRSNSSDAGGTESPRMSYGSMVSFDVEELDPENSLSGFLDHIPMSLRRWACYPMLLGRVRRNFKHVMLVDVKEMLLLGDPLSRVRNLSPESIRLSTVTPHSSPSKHAKKNSDKTQSTHQKLVTPAIITGGARGVRRLSNAMLTEIVRASTQHKKKNSVAELGLFNLLVANEFILKNVNLIVSAEAIPELSSLAVLDSKSVFSNPKYPSIRRGNSNLDILNSAVMKHICSFPLDSTVYSDCSF